MTAIQPSFEQRKNAASRQLKSGEPNAPDVRYKTWRHFRTQSFELPPGIIAGIDGERRQGARFYNPVPSEITVIRTPQLPQLNLARSPYERPFFVDMEAFFEFSFWLSEELLELESRFKDTQRCAGPKQADV